MMRSDVGIDTKGYGMRRIKRCREISTPYYVLSTEYQTAWTVALERAHVHTQINRLNDSPVQFIASLPMKLFLDSAKTDEIKHALAMWDVDGITTNPRHVRDSGKPFS